MSLDSEDDGIRWIKSKTKDLPEEKVFYQQGLVRVTDQVATFGVNRYSIWVLTSARKRRKLELSWASLFLIITSALIIVEAWEDGFTHTFDNGIEWALVILGIFAAGYALYKNERTKPLYDIQLDLPDSKISTYTALHEEDAAKIVDAINQAIAQRE